jgi:hypothetical protein
MVLVAIAVALTLVLGGTAFALFRTFSGGGAQPAEALPANAIGYLRIDLNPSAGQKLDAGRLLQKFPALSRYLGLGAGSQDIRPGLLRLVQRSGKCASLRYDQDIAPWLGQRAGLALLPPSRGSARPGVAVALQVTSPAAAEAGLASVVKACGGGSVPAHASVGNGYLVFAKTAVLARQDAAAARRHPLSANPTYRRDMARLGDPGVLSAWADLAAMAQVMPSGALPSGATTKQLARGSVAAAVRFDPSYVELAAVVSGRKTPTSLGANPVVDLPRSTLAAVSMSGLSSAADPLWSGFAAAAASSGTSRAALARTIRLETGLVLPADLTTLLGSNLELALDSRGFSLAQLALSGDPSQLRFGGRFQTGPRAFHAVLDKIEKHAAGHGHHLALNTVDGKGFVTVSTSASYAHQLAANGSLGATPGFQAAVPNASSATGVVYVNLDAVKAQLLQALALAGAPASEIATIRPVAGFGLSSWVPRPGVTQLSMRITVN